jgi:hypothetical protein
MTSGRPPRRLSDEETENLIRGLPRRQPTAALRARILSQAIRLQRAPARRPLFALAALLLLLLADVILMERQNSGLTPPAPTQAVARVPDQEEDDAAWLREVAAAAGLRRFALLREARPAEKETYLALRRLLMQSANGG